LIASESKKKKVRSIMNKLVTSAIVVLVIVVVAIVWSKPQFTEEQLLPLAAQSNPKTTTGIASKFVASAELANLERKRIRANAIEQVLSDIGDGVHPTRVLLKNDKELRQELDGLLERLTQLNQDGE
jgi:hypothetical protein